MIVSLQFLRAVAALLVVLFHVTVLYQHYCHRLVFGNFFGAGHSGVDIFFVLSGFLMVVLYYVDIVDRRGGAARFLQKRFRRIFPVFWCACLFSVGLNFLLGGKYYPTPFRGLLQSLLFFFDPSVILNVAWTLRIEFFFYSIFSLLFINVWLGLGVFSLWQIWVFVTIFILHHPYPKTIFDVRCLEFPMGMALAYLARFDLLIGRWVAIIGAGVFGTLFSFPEETQRLLTSNGQILIWGASASFVVFGLYDIERRNGIDYPRLFRLLGDASYSIYLVHFPVIAFCAIGIQRFGLSDWMNPNVIGLLLFVIAIVVGLTFYFAVERPFLRYKKILRDQKRNSIM